MRNKTQNIIMAVIGVGLLSASLAGCQSNPEKRISESVAMAQEPKWVSTPEKGLGENQVRVVWPLNDYLDSQQQAFQVQQLARRKLKQIVSKRIQAKQAEQVQAQADTQQSILEQKVRQKIRAQFSDWVLPDALIESKTYIDLKGQKVYGLAFFQPDSVQAFFLDKRQRYAENLTKHLHVSEKGSNLKQLIALMPVIKDLEGIYYWQAYLNMFSNKVPPIQNQKLVNSFEAHLLNIFDDFSASFEALDIDSEAYDLVLISALEKQGLKMGAQLPDLNIRYFIEVSGIQSNAKTGFVTVKVTGDYEIVSELGKQFTALNLTTQGYAKTKQQAVKEAIALQAHPMMEKLIQRLIDAKNL